MNDKEFSKKMYDSTEKENDLFPINAAKEIALRYKFASKYSKNKNILEIGPGTGYGSKKLIYSSNKYIGVEYSHLNTIQFKNMYPSIEIHNIDFLNFNINEKIKIDCIVSMANIYYFDFNKYLIKINQILRKNGELVFCTTNKCFPNFRPANNSTSYFSLEEIKSILECNDYTVKFYGVFKAKKSQLIKNYIKRSIKNILLFFFNEVSIKSLKKIMRDLVPLPKNIEDIDISNESIIEIDTDKESKNYLIIYCVARK